MEPSGLARTTIRPNSSSVSSRPCARTAYVNSCPLGTGSAPTCPAGFTLFCALMALTISGIVTLSLASWSGFTQKRMAYWPAPNTLTLAIPRTRVIWSLMLM
jgi:hypothetical protein